MTWLNILIIAFAALVLVASVVLLVVMNDNPGGGGPPPPPPPPLIIMQVPKRSHQCLLRRLIYPKTAPSPNLPLLKTIKNVVSLANP